MRIQILRSPDYLDLTVSLREANHQTHRDFLPFTCKVDDKEMQVLIGITQLSTGTEGSMVDFQGRLFKADHPLVVEVLNMEDNPSSEYCQVRGFIDWNTRIGEFSK